MQTHLECSLKLRAGRWAIVHRIVAIPTRIDLWGKREAAKKEKEKEKELLRCAF